MNPALAYAENNLEVHSVYQEALEAREELESVLRQIIREQFQRRLLTEQIADREADLLIAERGKHADMSATALDQHFRSVKRKDDQLRSLRDELAVCATTLDTNEYQAELLRHTIKIRIYRMEELGGYLSFLAAVKAAETAPNPSRPSSQTA